MSVDFTAWNEQVIAEFRANGGKCGGPFEGAPMVVLHNRGAKTGAERINPLVPLLDGDRMYVVASKAGAPDNPDWYDNVTANPNVTVEYLTGTFEADVVEVEDEAERSRLSELQVSRRPSFGEYREMTTRRIPVLELVRADTR